MYYISPNILCLTIPYWQPSFESTSSRELEKNHGIISDRPTGTGSYTYSLSSGSTSTPNLSIFPAYREAGYNGSRNKDVMTMSVGGESSTTVTERSSWRENEVNNIHDRRTFQGLSVRNQLVESDDEETNFQNELPQQSSQQSNFVETNGKTEIPEKFNILDWAGTGKPKRYIIMKLIQPKHGKIEERLTISHASDQVVWNILYIFDGTSPLPTESPSEADRGLAVQYMINFRSQFVKVFCDEAKSNYFLAVFQEEWRGLCRDGKPFKNFADLDYRTKDETKELVCVRRDFFGQNR